ncbi:matrix-remodeling-associated protein 7 isoform X3 [Calypte anna]|uniref:matrix-remodeling-associated protein 7 isoform X3 n=1 Tax=Calypte anna TaxID=9244 RepID=UPI0011C49FB6|nr:matrix-remodeling-associated protein 7 isoform X3 [Calypte anna]
MDLAVDSYVVVSLLFTVLAIVLAFVFVRLRGGEGERPAERPRQPAEEGEEAAEEAVAGPEDEGGRVPVEEVGAGEPRKEAVGEQRETATEPSPAATEPIPPMTKTSPPVTEPSPAVTKSIPPVTEPTPPVTKSIPPVTEPTPLVTKSIPPVTEPTLPVTKSISPVTEPTPPVTEPTPLVTKSIPPVTEPTPLVTKSIPPVTEPSPPVTESIPRQLPAEPRDPEPREEDAKSKIPPLGASPGSSPGQKGQAEGGCGHAALSIKAEEEDLDSENEKLVVRELEDEAAADEKFSFKYSPGKLRGNQYKSMMTKEELEEEQRTEDYMKLSLASS